MTDTIIATAFPLVAPHVRRLPFMFFALCMAAQFVVVLIFFSETKRRSLEALGTAL